MKPIKVIAILIGLIIFSGVCLKDKFCINFTKSAPRGLWQIKCSDNYEKGDWVIVKLPSSKMFDLAKERKYLSCKRLLKKVEATPSSTVKVTKNQILINNEIIPALEPFSEDTSCRKMPVFCMDRNLYKDEFFLVGISEKSFDSRYFGPVRKHLIKAKAIPIFVR